MVQALLAQSWYHNLAILENFAARFPAPQSDLARDITKDPYNFDSLRWATMPTIAIWSARRSLPCPATI
jgi:hypothetical protein